MPNTTRAMNRAKKIQDDEFYTRYEDIEKEMQYYKEYFKGKVILLPCDSEESSFVEYFNNKREEYGINAVLYQSTNDILNILDIYKHHKDELIVVTNPPFSMWRDIYAKLKEHDYKFIILGNNLAQSYRDSFEDLKNKNLTIGINCIRKFKNTDKTVYCIWYTNLISPEKRKEILDNAEPMRPDFPKYDNYDAIDCNKIEDLRWLEDKDYRDKIGVPITIFNYKRDLYEKYNILELKRNLKINNKKQFNRVIIQRK